MSNLISCQACNTLLKSVIDTLQVKSKLLKRQNECLQEGFNQAKQTEQKTRDELVVLRKDKQDLVEQLAVIAKKTTSVSKQVCNIMSLHRTGYLTLLQD